MEEACRNDAERLVNAVPSLSGESKERLAAPLAALTCLWLGFFSITAAALVGPSRTAPELEANVVTVLNQDASEAGFCTGSVIDPHVVLTAAHCVTRTAETQILFRDAHGAPVKVKAQAIAVHPSYRPDAIRRRIISIDLALIKLAEPLPPGFAPLEIAQSAPISPGEKFLLAGYGVADEHHSGTGGILRAGVLAAAGSKSPLLLWVADPAHAGLGACTGDSGAPILAFDKPTLVAVAVWAKGENGNHCGLLTQAVLIAPQKQWIESTLRSWNILGASGD